MATKRLDNNDELFAHIFVGAITASAAATVLAVPFYGFGPVLAYSAAVLVLGVSARMIEDALKNEQPSDKHKRIK